MAAAGDAAEVVLIDRDYKAKETQRHANTPSVRVPPIFWAPRRRLAHELEERGALVGLVRVRPARE
jgi:hypothetical protein